jgi:D-inositol-3-phosphate glycosyltransferase
MKKLLWIGDGPDVPSGFGRATREIIDRVRFEYDVTVLGINHLGDPGTVDYPVYRAESDYEPFGTRKLHKMCHLVKPDVIVIQQDGWNFPGYIKVLRAKKPNGEYHHPEHAAIPVVAAVAVDGLNFQGAWLDGISLAIFWTQFALDTARRGGYTGPAQVIPLGVDTKTYYPVPRDEALHNLKLDVLKNKFIVGNVNRNQPRKRWDLTVKYFAKWVNDYLITDAMLFLHAAPTGDMGVDVDQLARYYGVINMLALREPEPYEGISEKMMRDTYNSFSVQVSTTQGEGFGLTTLEGMACGVPQIVPDWSALGDWARRGAWMVPCSSTAIGPPFVNVVGGVPNEREFVIALHRMYVDARGRQNNAQAALECAQQPCFSWDDIGTAWVGALDDLLDPARPLGAVLSPSSREPGKAPGGGESRAEDGARPVLGSSPASSVGSPDGAEVGIEAGTEVGR